MLPPNLPSDASQRRVLRAFKKIGFEILPDWHGKGSHRMVRDPRSGIEITVQYHVYKELLKRFCKKLEELGYDASEFISKL